jgi:hypothetical protein
LFFKHRKTEELRYIEDGRIEIEDETVEIEWCPPE